jgi:predicted CXXCH cytochrome family protein
MPRAALGILAILALTARIVVAAPAAGDPHLDPSLLPDGCASCHVGHGESESPMMKAGQKQLCLGCHGDVNGTTASIVAGKAGATRLEQAAFGHPVDDQAFSRHEGRVTCTSCHSPHRGIRRASAIGETGTKKSSTVNPTMPEHLLCEGCHGAEAGGVRRPGTVAERVSSSNVSYHPVQAPANARSPSVRADLSGREINCTDCHGSDVAGARGPHASTIPHVLVRPYAAIDGEIESPRTYALCYGCHDRESILRGDSFPEHRRHIVDLKSSCSTCHDPHGSPRGRALSRLSPDERVGRLLPSTRTGILAFDSPGAGAGACHVSCHGRDHGPATYGAMDLLVRTGSGTTTAPAGMPSRQRSVRPGTGAGRGIDHPPARARDIDP